MTSLGTSILRALRRGVGSGAVVAVAAWYIRLVARTTRWTVFGRGGFDGLVAEPGGFVCVAWHGRLFMTPALAPGGKRTVAIISSSRDGDLIAAIVARWGVGALRGSGHDHVKHRSKGGVAVFRAAGRALRDEGALVTVTPDGPRGPRMRVQEGAVRLAMGQGVPVVAVAFSVRWGWNFGTWDRFLLPFPFGRGAVVYAPPRLAPEQGGPQAVERFRLALEQDLVAVTNQADDFCGRVRVLPTDMGLV